MVSPKNPNYEHMGRPHWLAMFSDFELPSTDTPAHTPITRSERHQYVMISQSTPTTGRESLHSHHPFAGVAFLLIFLLYYSTVDREGATRSCSSGEGVLFSATPIAPRNLTSALCETQALPAIL